MFTYDLILTAAGSSTRTKTPINKVFLDYGGMSLVENTYSLFKNDVRCRNIFVTTNSKDMEKMKQICSSLEKVTLIIGGDTRFKSVRNALKQCVSEFTVVHDTSRCYLTKQILRLFLSQLSTSENLIVAKKTINCLKKITADGVFTVNREQFVQTETPQGFRTTKLKKAYFGIEEKEYFDSSQVIELFYENKEKINFFFHDTKNKKITMPSDVNELKKY